MGDVALAIVVLLVTPPLAAALLHVLGVRDAPLLRTLSARVPKGVLDGIGMSHLREPAGDSSQRQPTWLRWVLRLAAVVLLVTLTVVWLMAAGLLVDSVRSE